MKNFDFKKLLPYAAALIVFAALTLSYFKPITDGYELRQVDVNNYKGMAKEIHDFRAMYGTDPLWTNSMFGGMPAYQIDVKNETNFLLTFDRFLQAGFPGVVGYFFLLFIGFFILLLCMKVDPWLAAIGATAYAFSSYFIIIVEAGHNTKVHALAYAPAVLGAFLMLLRGKMWLGAALFTFFMGLQLMSNHVQITYYLFMLMFIIGIGEFITVLMRKEGLMPFFTRTGFMIIGVGLAVMANSSNLWNTYEYGKDTTRGPSELTITPDGKPMEAEKGLDLEYMTQWSYGIDESWSFVFPSAKGGNSRFIGDLQDKNFKSTKALSPQNKNLIIQLAQMSQSSGGREGYVFNGYWGDQPFTSGPTYMGALIVFLFVLAFVFVKDPMKWAILIGCLIFLMLGWGKNYLGFTEFFANYFPGYNKFRSVSMILVLLELAMPFMAILFIKELVEDRERFVREKKKFLIASAATFGVLLLVYAMPNTFIEFMSLEDKNFFAAFGAQFSGLENEILDYRISVFRGDAMRSLGIIAAGFALIYLFVVGTLNKYIMYGGIGVIVIGDLYSFDRRFLNEEKYEGEYISWQKKGAYPYTPDYGDFDVFQRETQADPLLMKKVQDALTGLDIQGLSQQDAQLKQLNEAAFPTLNFNTNYRVLELTDPFNSSRIAYFHKSVGGYHGAKLKRYQELIEFAISRESEMIRNVFGRLMQDTSLNQQVLPDVMASIGLFDRTPVLNMLNTKYIKLHPKLPRVAQNPKAAGPAWFAKGVRMVNNANEEILAVANLQFGPEEKSPSGEILPKPVMTNRNIVDTVIVDKRFAVKNIAPVIDSSAYIRMKSYQPNLLVYECNNQNDGFAVFSEIYYDKGWKATIDGNPAEIVRVNYVLRGLDMPKGKHTVEFRFEPDNYKSMQTVSLMGNLLLLAAVAGFGYMAYRSSRPKKAA
jgi:hypothetical protein